MKALLVLFVCMAVSAGCASNMPRGRLSDTERTYLSYANDPVERFTAIGGIRSWEVVSDEYLVLRTNRNKFYLVKTWTCPDLKRARAIQVVSASSITISRGDKIRVEGDSCQIREIRPIDIIKLKAYQKAARQS